MHNSLQGIITAPVQSGDINSAPCILPKQMQTITRHVWFRVWTKVCEHLTITLVLYVLLNIPDQVLD